MTEPHDGSSSGDLPLPALVEGILFVTDAPIEVADLARALGVGRSEVERALAELALGCAVRGVRLQRTNGSVQLVSAPETAWAIERFFGLEASSRLSAAALETLSIIAYRQPVTRPEIESVRGVDCDGVMRTLLARGLVEAVGQRPTVGHPIEYGTTFLFLEYFGLSSVAELPLFEPAAPAADVAPDDFAPTARLAHAVRGNGHGPAPADAEGRAGADRRNGGEEPD